MKLAKISSVGVVTLATLKSLVTKSLASSPQAWIDDLTGNKQKLDVWVVELINWAIGLAALAAVVMLIAAGFMYITANGDEKRIGSATKTLTFAIVGLVVCFIAVMLVNFVLKTWLQQ